MSETKLNKPNIINMVAAQTGMSKKIIEEVIDSYNNIIKNETAAGKTINITGFGTYSVTRRVEREGRNPKTGESMTVAACNTPKFKAGKAFKNAVNK